MCRGWEQFVFDNDSADPSESAAYIQYWLINFGPNCPEGAGWTPYQNSCFRNSEEKIASVPQKLEALAQISLKGEVAGDMDTVTLSLTPDTLISAEAHTVLGLQQKWQDAEFNVFGFCCSGTANFNKGSTIIVRTSVDQGGIDAPTCVSNAGTTGEQNNLTLVAPCCPIAGVTSRSPAILFTASNAAGAKSLCACPAGEVWNPSSAVCQPSCTIPGQGVAFGKCPDQPRNACGGFGPITGGPGSFGEPCGVEGSGRIVCDSPNTTVCQFAKNACGGNATTIHDAPGEGSAQPGNSCGCSNGNRGFYYCTASKEVACGCSIPNPR